MASVKTCKVNPKYQRKYRVRNWAAYERGLRDRGAPDHTTLSRRNQTVEVPAFRRDHAGPIHLIVDSTGLKIFGAGEWNSRKHRRVKDRRGWPGSANSWMDLRSLPPDLYIGTQRLDTTFVHSRRAPR